MRVDAVDECPSVLWSEPVVDSSDDDADRPGDRGTESASDRPDSTIIAAAETKGYDPSLLKAAVDVNDKQPRRMVELLESHTPSKDRRIAVPGLAFKPGTDDVRNSRAIEVIESLQKRNAAVVAYDPVATDTMRERYPEIDYANSAADALRDAHGALVVTD